MAGDKNSTTVDEKDSTMISACQDGDVTVLEQHFGDLQQLTSDHGLNKKYESGVTLLQIAAAHGHVSSSSVHL